MIQLDFSGSGQGKFRSPQKDQALNIDGAQNYIIRARINRVGGGDWNGTVRWYGELKEPAILPLTTATLIRKESSTRQKTISEPENLDTDFVIVEWDMSDVNSWKDCIIKQINIIFENTGSNATYYVDWVEIGGDAPSKYEDGILSFPLRTNESAKRLKGTWAKIKYRAKTTDKFNIFAILAKYRETY